MSASSASVGANALDMQYRFITKRWYYRKVDCPYKGTDDAKNKACGKGFSVSKDHDLSLQEEEEVAQDLRCRMGQHLEATHEYNWKDALAVANDAAVQEWVEETKEKERVLDARSRSRSLSRSAGRTVNPSTVRQMTTNQLHVLAGLVQRELNFRR
jgi:hypothetical protein